MILKNNYPLIFYDKKYLFYNQRLTSSKLLNGSLPCLPPRLCRLI